MFVPIVIDQPTPLSPINDVRVDTSHPTFTFANAPHTGPVGPITYIIEVSDTDSFANTTGDLDPWRSSLRPDQSRVACRTGSTTGRSSGTCGRSIRRPSDRGRRHRYFGRRCRRPRRPPPAVCANARRRRGNHVGPGPLSEDRARQVVFATAAEFPHLTRVFGSDGEALSAASELLERTIWHLQLAGYQSGRQRNPSGVISDDKVTIFIDGSWHIYDIFSLGFAGRATRCNSSS